MIGCDHSKQILLLEGKWIKIALSFCLPQSQFSIWFIVFQQCIQAFSKNAYGIHGLDTNRHFYSIAYQLAILFF